MEKPPFQTPYPLPHESASETEGLEGHFSKAVLMHFFISHGRYITMAHSQDRMPCILRKMCGFLKKEGCKILLYVNCYINVT